MVGLNTNILTVNVGSSSVKLAVIAYDELSNPQQLVAISAGTHDQPRTVVEQLLKELDTKVDTSIINVVGYRAVYGGQGQSGPQVIDMSLIQRLRDVAELDPEHTPALIEIIEILTARFETATHIVCYDTTFYNDLPRVAQLLPIPHRFQSDGLRRYGFHGLSYEYLMSTVEKEFGSIVAHGRIIFAHLGSGASLTATKDMKTIDTTMGITPASGVMMSNRSGDVDPGLVSYLHQKYGMDIKQYDHMIHHESGLLGVSGLSNDMLTLLNAESTNPKAAEAIELFCYDIKKAIGSLVATLGGVDSIVFSGGIGEQSASVRKRICTGLEYLGIQINDDRNDRHDRTISADGSNTGVHVFTTNENEVIAGSAYQYIQKQGHA